MEPEHPLKGGFDRIGPLAGRSSVHIAFRPVDPLVEERVRSLFADLSGSIGEGAPSVSLGIRSVDGFFCTSEGSDPLSGTIELVRVLNYDPVRGIFLLVGDPEPDPTAAIMWFGFKAFEDCGAICSISERGAELDLPDDQEGRNGSILEFLRLWKDENPASFGAFNFSRVKNLEGTRSFISGHMVKD